MTVAEEVRLLFMVVAMVAVTLVALTTASYLPTGASWLVLWLAYRVTSPAGEWITAQSRRSRIDTH